MSKKELPAWLSIGPDGATITLPRPLVMNGVKQNKVTLREPTVGDMRASAKQHPDDKEAQEIHLFASLAGCAPADIERLTMKGYARVQEGYFRLNADDDGEGTEGARQTIGE